MSRKIGEYAEKIASNYLKERGYEIVEVNYNAAPLGEIDLIARDGFFLVFIEVKYSSTNDPTIFDKINRSKKRKLENAAKLYLQRKKLDLFCRFDAIFIFREDDLYKIEHFENIIT